MMHQSSMGTVVILLGYKLSPLWQSGFLTFFFLVTAISMGFAAVTFESILSSVAFKRPFEEVILAENLVALETQQSIELNDAYRIYPVSVADLLAEGSKTEGEGVRAVSKYAGDKWGGKYLRAPDVFVGLIARKDDLFCSLAEIAVVSGYVHDNNIGDKYPPTRFIKSIRESRKIGLTQEATYQYGVAREGNNRDIADILFARTYGQDHLVLLNMCRSIGKEFYKITVKKIRARSLALYLNSTFCVLQRELFGVTNLGGGAIKFSGDDLRMFLFPLKLIQGFSFPTEDRFIAREIKSIFEEIGVYPLSGTQINEQEPAPLPDRKALDDIVFDALGLSEEERKQVYRAVCQLVWERISKAKSVTRN